MLKGDYRVQPLAFNEQTAIAGGYDIVWGDVFAGALFATDVACVYSRNPWVCGAALVAHGVLFFLD